MPRDLLAPRKGRDLFAKPVEQSVAMDMAKAAPSGLARGTADLIGLPGTVGDLMRSGLEGAMRGGYKLATGDVPNPESDSAVERFFAGPSDKVKAAIDTSMPLSGQSLKGHMSKLTDGATDYQPSTTAGEYTRTIAEFLPGAVAFGGGSAANLVKAGVAPAVTSESAGQLTEDTKWEPLARIVGALVGGFGGSRIGQSKQQKLPSAAEIKESAGYGDKMTKVLRQARLSDDVYQGTVKSLWDDLRQAGTSFEVQQNFGRTLQNELRMTQQGGSTSLHDLERLRRALRRAGGGKLDTPSQAIAERLIDKLDAAVDDLSEASIAAGGETGRPVLDVLKEARSIYHTGKKSDVVERALRNAQNAASGVESGLRNEFNLIAKNDKLMRGFTEAEQEAIRSVGQGTFTSNALRWLGSFGVPIDQGRNFLGSLSGGGVGATIGGMLGGPAGATLGGIALPVIGTAAKVGASKATKAQADIVEALVKAGPRRAEEFSRARAAHQVDGREEIMRALLQSQSAGRVPNSKEYAR